MTAPVAIPVDLQPLQRALESAGVEVRIALPPRKGVYGLYQPRDRRLWVAPITGPLGIFRATYLHEAVHAAQACSPSGSTLLGVKTSLTPVINRRIQSLLFSNYSHGQSALEREAFEIQGRSDAVPLLISYLNQRCKNQGQR